MSRKRNNRERTPLYKYKQKLCKGGRGGGSWLAAGTELEEMGKKTEEWEMSAV